MTLVLLDVEAAPTEPKAPPTEEVGFLRHMHKKGTGNQRLTHSRVPTVADSFEWLSVI